MILKKIISAAYAYDFFFDINLSHVVTSKRSYDKNSRIGKTAQMFIKTDFNNYSIIQDPEVCFLVGVQKHSKAKTNILRYINHIR